MERATVELERRSRHLSSLIQMQKRRSSGDNRAAAKGVAEEVKVTREEEEVVVVVKEQKEAEADKDAVAGEQGKGEKQRKGEGDAGTDPGERHQGSVRVRAADMPPELQKRAFRSAQRILAGMPKLDSKRLALTLKKEFDSSYGPAWHCIVGKSFGSYVTHSLGGFLYFSIDKLHVPGCNYLTADGVMRAVKKSLLVDARKGSLKQLRLNGVSNITKDHLDALKSILEAHPQPCFYSDWCSQPLKDDRPLDVDICPKCDRPRLVFDCTRKNCRRLMKGSRGECRGCIFCIPRCGECGGCVAFQELGEESACSHLLCLECWLQLPKCSMCNRPYCRKHHQDSPLPQCSSNTSGTFVCEDCQRHEDYPFFDL